MRYEVKRRGKKAGADMRRVEVSIPDRVDAMPFNNEIVVSVRNLNVSENNETFLFTKVKQIEDSNMPLRDGDLLHLTSLRVAFCIYRFDYSHCILFVIFLPGMSAKDMNTLSTKCTTIGHLVLNNGGKVRCVDGHHRLCVMRQVQVMGGLEWI